MDRRIVLIASLVAGLGAALLTRVYLASKETEFRRREVAATKKWGGETEALCLVRALPSGSEIRTEDLTNCVTVVKGNGDVVPPSRIRDIVGLRTFGLLKAGVPLRWSYFENSDINPRSLSARIPERRGEATYRAISVSVGGAASVSGMIRPGDKVDVIGTLVFPNDEGRVHRGDPVTLTLLQNVDVLATGGDATTARARGLGVTDPRERDTGYSLVTLVVTPREAEMLAFVEQAKGRITLTLRGRDDLTTESGLKPVHYDTIREEIETLNGLRRKARGNGR